MILGAFPFASVSFSGARHPLDLPAPTPEPTPVGKPTSDVVRGSWLPSVGSALYAMLDEDEATPDFIQATTLSTCEISLGAMTVPGNRMRYKAASSLGNGLVFELLSGGVLVARWAHSLTATDDLYSHNLTPEQVAMMTGGDMTARMTATQ